MKKIAVTSLPVGVAVFCAVLMPSSAFAMTGDGDSGSNSSGYETSITTDGQTDGSNWGGTGGWPGNTTGPGSVYETTNNQVQNYDVTNHNNLNADQNNQQSAISGDAYVSGNTTAGSAQTGNAANKNQSDTCIGITNGSNGAQAASTNCSGATQGGGMGAGVPVLPQNSSASPEATPQGGMGGGQVLGASTTAQTALPAGGFGAGAAFPSTLPNTGASQQYSLLFSFLAAALTSAVVWRRQRAYDLASTK